MGTNKEENVIIVVDHSLIYRFFYSVEYQAEEQHIPSLGMTQPVIRTLGRRSDHCAMEAVGR